MKRPDENERSLRVRRETPAVEATRARAPAASREPVEALRAELSARLTWRQLAELDTEAARDPAGIYLTHLVAIARETGLDTTTCLPWNAPPTWSAWVAPYYEVLAAERGLSDHADSGTDSGTDSGGAGAAVQRLASPGATDEDEEWLSEWFDGAVRGGGPGRAPTEREQALLVGVHGRRFPEARIHEGAGAAARAIGARAFTVGRDIYLPAGVRGEDPEGAELLAHEATHVAQAVEGRLPGGDGLSLSQPDQAHEREAEARGREGRRLASADPWGLRGAPAHDDASQAVLFALASELPDAAAAPPEALVHQALGDWLRGELLGMAHAGPDEAVLAAARDASSGRSDPEALRGWLGLVGAPDPQQREAIQQNSAPYPTFGDALDSALVSLAAPALAEPAPQSAPAPQAGMVLRDEAPAAAEAGGEEAAAINWKTVFSELSQLVQHGEISQFSTCWYVTFPAVPLRGKVADMVALASLLFTCKEVVPGYALAVHGQPTLELAKSGAIRILGDTQVIPRTRSAPVTISIDVSTITTVCQALDLELPSAITEGAVQWAAYVKVVLTEAARQRERLTLPPEQLQAWGLDPSTFWASVADPSVQHQLAGLADDLTGDGAVAPVRAAFQDAMARADGDFQPSAEHTGDLSSQALAAFVVALYGHRLGAMDEQERADEQERLARLKEPSEVTPADPALFIAKTLDPSSTYPSALGVISGGMDLRNVRGEEVTVLNCRGGAFLFQNKDTGKFYTQLHGPFVKDLRAAILTDIARRCKGLNDMAMLVLDFVGYLFPAGYIVTVARVVTYATFYQENKAAISQASGAIWGALSWLNDSYPELTRALLISAGLDASLSALNERLVMRLLARSVGSIVKVVGGGGASAGVLALKAAASSLKSILIPFLAEFGMSLTDPAVLQPLTDKLQAFGAVESAVLLAELQAAGSNPDRIVELTQRLSKLEEAVMEAMKLIQKLKI